MARIAGVDIPRDKRVDVSLRYIFGIGPGIAGQICTHAAVSPETKKFIPSSTISDMYPAICHVSIPELQMSTMLRGMPMNFLMVKFEPFFETSPP